jgi:molecular chaperone DnaK (HSP70)
VDEAAEELAKATGYSLPSVHGSKVKITNVTSKSFGVVVKNLGGQEHVFNLIFRNNAVPADVSKTFFTAVDDQDTVLIQIMENEIDEQAVPVDNAIRVGTAKFKLPDGLPSDSPIEIYFNLNHEGRLSITAEETTHNGSVDVEIETSSVIEGDALKEAKARSQSLVVH